MELRAENKEKWWSGGANIVMVHVSARMAVDDLFRMGLAELGVEV